MGQIPNVMGWAADPLRIGCESGVRICHSSKRLCGLPIVIASPAAHIYGHCMSWQKLKHIPESVTIGSLRMFNTYDLTGTFEGRQSRLEDLVLEHLSVQSELRKLDAYAEVLVRMVAEGYNQREIAEELGVSAHSVGRRLRDIRSCLYGTVTLTR